MAELFDRFTDEQKLALTHSNNFTEVYNEQVVAKMNQMCAQFPDINAFFREMECKIKGFNSLLNSANDQVDIKNNIKEMIEKTQRFQLTMLGQLQLCDRLKRETKYGIIGDASVSAANPSS